MQGNKASEKVISYMREEMAATAEKGEEIHILLEEWSMRN